MIEPTEYLGLTLDAERLAILGHAAVGAVDVDDLAEKLGISRKKLLGHYAKLEQVGLLTSQGRLDRRVLQRLGAALPQVEPAAEEVTSGPWSPAEADVLRRFFTGARLERIPAQHTKRKVVLERLAQEFEPGLRYPERQVNFVLQMFHRDYAALRRYLVDEGFLTRADGVYWRTGGRFEPAASTASERSVST